MALPLSISGADAASANSYSGPFKWDNAFYVSHRDMTSGNDSRVDKATDPETSFAEQDGTNVPTFAATIASQNAFQVNNLLHIAAQTTANDVFYARFDMDADAWVDLDAGAPVDEDILIDGAPDGTPTACDIVVLNTGKIRVVYQGEMDKVMGTSFERIHAMQSTDGFTWSNLQSVSTATAETDFTGPRMVVGDSDTVHIVYRGATDTPEDVLYQRAMSSADALQTERDTTGQTMPDFYPIGHGVSFDRSGTTKIRFPFSSPISNDDTLLVLTFDAATDPSSFTLDTTPWDGSTSALSVRNQSGDAVLGLAADGDTVYMVQARDDDSDFYTSNDGGNDTWTTPVVHRSGITGNQYHANVFERGGSIKLAQYQEHSSQPRYDEADITPNFALLNAVSMPNQNYQIGPHEGA